MKIYLYLARRNKKGIEVLSVLDGSEHTAVRITDIAMLKLPAKFQSRIQKYVHEHRMHWELWLESADSYAELKERLKSRGYQNVPFYSGPIIEPDKEKVVANLKDVKTYIVPDRPQKKTMLRKSTDLPS